MSITQEQVTVEVDATAYVPILAWHSGKAQKCLFFYDSKIYKVFHTNAQRDYETYGTNYLYVAKKESGSWTTIQGPSLFTITDAGRGDYITENHFCTTQVGNKLYIFFTSPDIENNLKSLSQLSKRIA